MPPALQPVTSFFIFCILFTFGLDHGIGRGGGGIRRGRGRGRGSSMRAATTVVMPSLSTRPHQATTGVRREQVIAAATTASAARDDMTGSPSVSVAGALDSGPSSPPGDGMQQEQVYCVTERRPRATLSDGQRQVLQEYFQKEMFPDKEVQSLN